MFYFTVELKNLVDSLEALLGADDQRPSVSEDTDQPICNDECAENGEFVSASGSDSSVVSFISSSFSAVTRKKILKRRRVEESENIQYPMAKIQKSTSSDEEVEFVSASRSDSSVVSIMSSSLSAVTRKKRLKRRRDEESEDILYPMAKNQQSASSDEEVNEEKMEKPNKKADGELKESDIIRDKNIKGLYIKKQGTKTPKGMSTNDRLYDNLHACYFCGKVVLHIKLHLQTRKHRKEDLVKKVLASDKPDFTLLRKMGDDKHNRKCTEKGEGQIILARRPKGNEFDVTKFGPCVICKEWVCLKGIKYHFNECKKQQHSNLNLKKRDLVVQSRILAGHIRETASPLLKNEVLPIMTNDNVSRVAQEDPLIMALGDSWVRRNMSNVEKRKYYASSRMRLVARMLIQLNMMKKTDKTLHDENKGECSMEDSAHNDAVSVPSEKHSSGTATMFDFLKPSHFDDIVIATLRCSFPNADDMEELSAPSNAIKLKYDIIRMLNSKWAFIVKKTNESNEHAQECQAFLKLMDVEWKEKVSVLAHAVLNRRRYEIVKELPSPEDIQSLTQHLVKALTKTPCETENFQKMVVLAQARLLLYNKRRTGELEVIK